MRLPGFAGRESKRSEKRPRHASRLPKAGGLTLDRHDTSRVSSKRTNSRSARLARRGIDGNIFFVVCASLRNSPQIAERRVEDRWHAVRLHRLLTDADDGSASW